MEDWSKRTDQRDTEIRHREFLLNQKLLTTQVEAAAAQRDAARVMEQQAKTLFWTAIIAAASAIAAFATALVTYLVAK